MKVYQQTFSNGRGYALPNFRNDGDVAFFADLPDHVVVDAVRVNGQFLEDVAPAAPLYPRTLKEGGMRVVAIVNDLAGTPFHDVAAAHLIESFDVLYHEEAVVTVR